MSKHFVSHKSKSRIAHRIGGQYQLTGRKNTSGSSPPVPAGVYASPAASGANDGSSFDDAFTDLQEALTALTAGETLYTDAPASNPFIGGYTISGKDNFSIVTNTGPNGQTNLTNARKATWSDEGGGVFSATVSTPTHVVYDFKQDNNAGAVTGIDFTDSKWSAPLATSIWSESNCLPWYGFLTQNVSTPTAPSEGEWGYSGGKVYVNPPGSPTLQNVTDLCEYCTGTVNGLTVTSCDGWSISGNLIGRLYPNHLSNTGYIVKGHSVANGTIENVISVASGYHCCGFAGSSTTGNSIKKCLSNGVHTEIPFVFYSDTDQPTAGHVGEDLGFVAYPLLRHDGKTLERTDFAPRAAYSHSTGGNTLGGISYKRLFMWDASHLLTAYNDSPLDTPASTNASGIVGMANGIYPTDRDTYLDYSITCEDSHAVGRNALFQSHIAHKNCTFDRRDAGHTDDRVLHGAGAYTKCMHLTNCTIYTGDFQYSYMYALTTGSGYGLHMDNCTIYAKSSQDDTAIFGAISLTSECLHLENNNILFDGDTIEPSVITVGNQAGDGGGTGNPVLFVHSENNTYDMPVTRAHSNVAVTPLSRPDWTTNVSATDTFNGSVTAPYFRYNPSLKDSVDDISGFRRHAVNVGSLPTVANTGSDGVRAYDFVDGDAKYIDTNINGIDNELSMSLWVNFKSLPTVDDRWGLISKYNGNGLQSPFLLYSYFDDPTKVRFWTSTGTAQTLISNTVFSINTWYHVAVTRASNGDKKIYVNGVEDATGADNGNALRVYTGSEIRIGYSNSNYLAPDAMMDDVCLWFGHVLTAAEVLSLASSRSQYFQDL